MMNRIFISLLLLISVLFVNAFASSTDNLNFKKTFQSTEGVVTFDHGAHAYGRVKDCVECHSALKTFGNKVNELFAHNFCKACHESNNAPAECSGCHKEEIASK